MSSDYEITNYNTSKKLAQLNKVIQYLSSQAVDRDYQIEVLTERYEDEIKTIMREHETMMNEIKEELHRRRDQVEKTVKDEYTEKFESLKRSTDTNSDGLFANFMKDVSSIQDSMRGSLETIREIDKQVSEKMLAVDEGGSPMQVRIREMEENHAAALKEHDLESKKKLEVLREQNRKKVESMKVTFEKASADLKKKFVGSKELIPASSVAQLVNGKNTIKSQLELLLKQKSKAFSVFQTNQAAFKERVKSLIEEIKGLAKQESAVDREVIAQRNGHARELVALNLNAETRKQKQSNELNELVHQRSLIKNSYIADDGADIAMETNKIIKSAYEKIKEVQESYEKEIMELEAKLSSIEIKDHSEELEALQKNKEFQDRKASTINELKEELKRVSERSVDVDFVKKQEEVFSEHQMKIAKIRSDHRTQIEELKNREITIPPTGFTFDSSKFEMELRVLQAKIESTIVLKESVYLPKVKDLLDTVAAQRNSLMQHWKTELESVDVNPADSDAKPNRITELDKEIDDAKKQLSEITIPELIQCNDLKTNLENAKKEFADAKELTDAEYNNYKNEVQEKINNINAESQEDHNVFKQELQKYEKMLANTTSDKSAEEIHKKEKEELMEELKAQEKEKEDELSIIEYEIEAFSDDDELELYKQELDEQLNKAAESNQENITKLKEELSTETSKLLDELRDVLLQIELTNQQIDTRPMRDEERAIIERLNEILEMKTSHLINLGKELVEYRNNLIKQEEEYNQRFGSTPSIALYKNPQRITRPVTTSTEHASVLNRPLY